MRQKLKMIVVVPCLAEDGIWDTIESLRKNSGYKHLTECVLVINHSENESQEKKLINRKISGLLKPRLPELCSDSLKFEVVEAFDLPARKGGVGLARKIGMDLAIRKFKEKNTFDEGIVICLDGDCTVTENYLMEIESYFESYNANGCSIYFEHPLNIENAQAIIEYELYLRYYTNALRWSGFPFAFQTVGSSMAVSARAYEKQGGMNTRQAGEDFYFLNKIIQLGNFGDLTSATVFPSSRKSDRVPFGTGREMMEWEDTRQQLAYPPDLFVELKKIFDTIDDLRDSIEPMGLLEKKKVNPAILHYLDRQKFNEAVFDVKENTATLPAFRKRFFVWMNAFRVIKLLNELSGSSYKKVPIQTSASWLWSELTNSSPTLSISKELLIQYRKFDRANSKWIEGRHSRLSAREAGDLR